MCNNAEQTLGGFLCPRSYSIEMFSQCSASIILWRVFCLVHQLNLIVNILFKIDVHHGLQKFVVTVRILVNISLDIRLPHRGIPCRLVYLMTSLFS